MDIIINSWMDSNGKRRFFWYEPDNKNNEGSEIFHLGAPIRELEVKDGKLVLFS